jgi:2-phospho-L-lactate/phosphoenolpyruvate guanylyltransferase
MSVHAVIPFRSAQGKTRLAAALTEAQRGELVRAMAMHVIETVSATPGIDRVHLLTNEAALDPHSCAHLADRGAELNAAVAHAAREVRALGAERLLIVHADLPFVTEEEIRALVLASADDALVAAPDLAESGTNALGFSLSREIATRFGAGSLAAHRLAAQEAGLSFRLVRSAGLANDIDEPAQLEALLARGGAPYAFLEAALRARGPHRGP